MIIRFKDKKNSSGQIKDGEIVLYISSRLPRQEQQRHIELLAQRLQARLATLAPAAAPLPEDLLALPTCPAQTDAELLAWARELNERHFRFAMGDVRFRNQRTRWGSCSGITRNIYLSTRLRQAPAPLAEYVLIHELAHLKEMNHGPRFWKLVARACPEYVERRAQLNRWGRWREAQPEA